MTLFFPKLRSSLAQLGFLDTIYYGTSRLAQRWTGKPLIYRYAIMAQPVPDRPLLPPRRGRDIEIRLLLSPDPILGELELTPEVVAHRFRQGAVCFAAFKNDRIIGSLWLCCGPYFEDEVRCRFDCSPRESTCWDFGLYLTPAYRGGIAFARLWDAANAYLRERAIAWSFSRVGRINPGSLASHKRLGARQLGTATFFCVGGWQLMLTSLPPYFQLSRRSAPTLRLRPPQSLDAPV